MKNFIYLFLMMSLLLLPGCKEELENGQAKLTFIENIISVSAGGGDIEVEYTLENPTPDGKFSASTESTDWITGWDFSKEGVMTLTIAPNESDRSRDGYVTVTYADCQSRIMVRQAAPDEAVITMTINEEDITLNSVIITFNCSDPETTYAGMYIPLSQYENDLGGDDEELFMVMYNSYVGYAEQMGMSLHDFLVENILMTGERTAEITGLNVNTEYMMFAVGLSADGEKTTETIYKEYFTTKNVEQVDMTFDIDVEVEKVSALVKVHPSRDDHRYWFDKVSVKELEDAGQTAKEYYQYAINATIKFTAAILGMTAEETVEHMCEYGDSEYYFTDDEDGTTTLAYQTDYIVAAFALSAEGIINSEVTEHPFSTGPCEPSDNQFDINITEVSSDRMIISMGTTNNDPWSYSIAVADQIADKSDDEILESLKKGSYKAYTGDMTLYAVGMSPEKSYVVLAFGYDHGAINTEIFKSEVVTTQSVGNVEDLTFDFTVDNLTPTQVDVVVKGDPITCMYWYMVVSPGYTEDMIKDYLESLALLYEDIPLNYYLQIGERGTSYPSTWNIYSMDEFKVMAVGINDETGELGPAGESEVYQVPDFTYNDNIGITINWDKVFDGTEISETYGRDPGSYYYGSVAKAVVPVTVELTGNPARWAVGYVDGDRENVSDTEAMFWLNDFPVSVSYNTMRTDFVMMWDTENTFFAVAWDEEGNISQVYKEKVIITRDMEAPFEEFDPLTNAASMMFSRNADDISLLRTPEQYVPEIKVNIKSEQADVPADPGTIYVDLSEQPETQEQQPAILDRIVEKARNAKDAKNASLRVELDLVPIWIK